MVNSKAAYVKGWAASRRSATADLDRAEDRFVWRHGHEYVDDFIAGWTDYATGRDKRQTWDDEKPKR